MYWETVDCNYSTDEELESIVNKLKRVAPRIHWKITYYDHDLGPYSVLEVPEDEWVEAEYIVDRYENGDDLKNYSYKDKYPNTFLNVDGKKVINPTIIEFYKCANDFCDLIEEFNSYKLEDFLDRMIILLPKFYIAVNELKSDYLDINYYEQEISYEDLEFGKYEFFYDSHDIFRSNDIEEYSVTKLIE